MANSSSPSTRSATGEHSEPSFSSSAASSSFPLDFPQRVATCKPTPDTLRSQRARHLCPVTVYGRSFTQNFQDWNYNWVTCPDVDTAGKLLEYIKTEHGLHWIPEEMPIHNLGGGDFNQVFIFRSSADKQQGSNPDGLPDLLVLRIGWPLAPKVKLESDVATMTYARRNVGLPVPRVFFYDSGGTNPWGYEWSIMEYVGDASTIRNAGNLWDNPLSKTLKQLALSIASYCNRLSDPELHAFGQLGSLYFSNWESDYCGAMGHDGYTIGPLTDTDFWGGPRAYYASLNRGPYNSITEYLSALARIQVLDARNEDIPSSAFDAGWAHCNCKESVPITISHNSVTCLHREQRRAKWLRLAEQVHKVLVPAVCQKARAEAVKAGRAESADPPSVLWHHDLHGHNIFVSALSSPSQAQGQPTIKALIDWEAIAVLPRCLHPAVPKIAHDFSFLKEDRGNFPVGEHVLGPSLQDLFEGYAKRTSMFPKVFNPPEESTNPWGVALCNLSTMISRMWRMEEEDVEWWMEAFAYLNLPLKGHYRDIDMTDFRDANGDGDIDMTDPRDDGEGPPTRGAGTDRGKNKANKSKRTNPDGGGDNGRGKRHRPEGQGMYKFQGHEGNFFGIWRGSAKQSALVPFSVESFLKLPFSHSSEGSHRPADDNSIPEPSDKRGHSSSPSASSDPASSDSGSNKKVKKRPPKITVVPVPDMEDVKLTPSSARVSMRSPGSRPVQVTLQELMRGIENNQHLYQLNGNNGANCSPPSPWPPKDSHKSWLPSMFSQTVCC